MASISRITPGQTLYTVTTERMGNTAMRCKVVNPVYVKEVNVDDGYVLASWNGNPVRKYPERMIKNWRVKKPKVKERNW